MPALEPRAALLKSNVDETTTTSAASRLPVRGPSTPGIDAIEAWR
jgi:hypothetical protein